MYFKDLKQGYSLFVFNKTTMTVTTNKVKGVSLPHVDPKITSTTMVVDVTLEGNSTEGSVTYCMPCDTDIAYPQNMVITTDKSNILREIEAMKTTAEQSLSQIDNNKDIISKANILIADLDPSQREKQQMESRISSMESSIKQMMSMLAKMQQK